MTNETVKKRINATGYSYMSYNYMVHFFLFADWWVDYTSTVAYVLDVGKIPVLSYNGDKDFICNWIGEEAWVNDFEWSGKGKFKDMKYKDWIFNKKVGGRYKTLNGLTFLIIKDSGHMTPKDQPEFSLDMINKFMFEGIKE